MTNNDSKSPLISFRGVGVSYWRKKGMLRRERYFPLEDVSFDLYRGDSLGVIGRNGAGKSTLLRLIAGVMTPDYGKVIGADQVTASLLTLQLGFVDYLSGRENAILGGMFLGMRKRDVEARLDQIIEFSELQDFIDQPLFTYSSGMRARLGFAVAFQLEPDILLIDEVAGVGDVSFREKSFQMIRQRLRSESSTVVFVSHTTGQIRSLCNRALWLEDHVVRMAGPVDEVVTAYEMAQARAGGGDESAPVNRPLFYKRVGSNTLYALEGGSMRVIHSWSEFLDLGGNALEVESITKERLDELLASNPLGKG